MRIIKFLGYFFVHRLYLTLKFASADPQHPEPNGRELYHTVGGNYSYILIFAYLGHEPLDIYVARLPLLGIDDVYIVIIEILAAAARHHIGVKDEHDLAACKGGVVAKDIRKPVTGGGYIGLGKEFKLLPCKNAVVAVDDDVFFAFGILVSAAVLLLIGRLRTV